MSTPLERKRSALEERLGRIDSALVALSGGVDSSLVLAIAARAVRGPVVAVTAVTPLHGGDDAAREVAARLGVRLVELAIPVLDEPALRENPPDRCYLCKRAIFARLAALAAELGLAAVLEGSNADDLDEFRPGRRALAEVGAVSPLAEAGLRKAEVRELAAALGLPSARRSSDTCGATRFPYGTRLTEEAIERVRAAEAAVAAAVGGPVRVRAHGDVARLEVGQGQIAAVAAPETRRRIAAAVRGAGFRYVALDLDGYRSGAMDEALTAAQRRAALGEG